jgi:hypothetical protein
MEKSGKMILEKKWQPCLKSSILCVEVIFPQDEIGSVKKGKCHTSGDVTS